MRSHTGELPISEAYLIPQDAQARPWTGVLRREVWRFLPAWMYFIYALGLLNTELTNFSPPRADLASTALFPLAVFVIFATVRAFKAPDVENRWATFFATVGVAMGLPLLIYFFHRPSPLSLPTLLNIYEYSNFAWAALMVWHALKHHRSHVALFFGVGLFYGMLLENGGILLGFFHEMNLAATAVKPFVAPVATMIGWCVVLYMATFVVWRLRAWLPWLRRSALVSALAVGAFATMLDLQIDPIATAAGCWVWHESLPAWFHGVPLVNFIAWMCALAPFAYVMFRVQEHHRLRDNTAWSRKALLTSLAWAPGALLLATLCFLTATLIAEGAAGPSWNIVFTFTHKWLTVLLG